MRDVGRGDAATAAPGTTLTRNGDFWRKSHDLHEGARVLLDTFAVTEWAPALPGPYQTQRAKKAALKPHSS